VQIAQVMTVEQDAPARGIIKPAEQRQQG
jgi:hypothetical protein